MCVALGRFSFTFQARLRWLFVFDLTVFRNFSRCFPLVSFPFTPFKDGFQPLVCAVDVFNFDALLDIDVGCTLIVALLL